MRAGVTSGVSNYYPLGFPVRLTTGAAAVHEAAEAAWGHLRQLFEAEIVDVFAKVRTGETAEPGEVAFKIEPEGFRFALGQGNFAKGNWRRHCVTVEVAESVVSDRAYFRYYFLEAAVNQLLCGLRMTPIHAACVTPPVGGGVLLCGDSGAGKSSLAFACARSGWTYTSDDASYLPRDGGMNVVGDAHRMRMRPESVNLFPELKAVESTRRGNGDIRLQLWTRDLQVRTAERATIERIVQLRRGDEMSEPLLGAWKRAEAEEWFQRVFYHWAPDIGQAQSRALQGLLDNARLETLSYSRLADAVRVLEARSTD